MYKQYVSTKQSTPPHACNYTTNNLNKAQSKIPPSTKSFQPLNSPFVPSQDPPLSESQNQLYARGSRVTY